MKEEKNQVKADNCLSNYNDVLVPEDICKILHTGLNRVYEYLQDGTIRSIKIGRKYRIPKGYLIDYLYPDKEK